MQKRSKAYMDQAQLEETIRKFINDDNEKTHVQERRVVEKIHSELDHARKKVGEAALILRDEKSLRIEDKLHVDDGCKIDRFLAILL